MANIVNCEIKFTTSQVDPEAGFSFDGNTLDNSTFILHMKLDVHKNGDELLKEVLSRFTGKGTVSDISIKAVEPIAIKEKPINIS